MKNELLYVLPILKENERTLQEIRNAIMPLKHFYKGEIDAIGRFFEVKNNLIGDFYVFQSPDEIATKQVEKAMKIYEQHTLPIRTVESQRILPLDSIDYKLKS
ncbi:MAG: hypothetical protein WC755_03255 [Candidatus Woesearchaeota archaeon]|jgi:hypothetical protein